MKTGHRNSANTRENFANEPASQVTLRELHALIVNPRFWIGLAAVILILAVSGPFDTQDLLDFPARFFYWMVISISTFFTGIATSVFIGTLLYQRGMQEMAARLLSGIVAGVPITLIVWNVNIHGFDFDMGPPDTDTFWRVSLYCTAISVAIVLLYYLVSLQYRGDEAAGAAVPQTVKESPFVDRLPVELGRDIVSLQAQDHYIQVHTTKGSEMILMRLSDAEKELAVEDGIRTHRSWWVARQHIERLKRDGDRMFLVLDNGTEVPVSRSYAKAVRSLMERQPA